MIKSTLPIAVAVVLVLYLFAVRNIPWKSVTYGIFGALVVALVVSSKVHLSMIGLWIMALAVPVIEAHYYFVERKKRKVWEVEPPERG